MGGVGLVLSRGDGGRCPRAGSARATPASGRTRRPRPGPRARGSSRAQGAAVGIQLAHAGPQGVHPRAVARRPRGRRGGRRLADGRAERAALRPGLPAAARAHHGRDPRRGRRLRRRRGPRAARPASTASRSTPRTATCCTSSSRRSATRAPTRTAARSRTACASRSRWRARCARPGREQLPLFVRISATDWAEGGWDLEQSVELCRRLREAGVDLVDCSSGGLVAAREDRARPRLPGALRGGDPRARAGSPPAPSA